MPRKWSQLDDLRLRLEAIEWLRVRTDDGKYSLTREEINDFFFDGEPFKLIDPMKGIRKPQVLDTALSIMTSFRKPGEERPYADEVGPDGMPRYKWEGSDPHKNTNAGLRLAKERDLPLIWFIGVGGSPMRFHVLCPVKIVGEEADQEQFVLSIAAEKGLSLADLIAPDGPDTIVKKYLVRETKARLHQPVFRASVIRAYQVRCAVCNLGHAQLLDAAHIIPDVDEDGIAAVTNGLTLCKIHHAAFDSHILGITPDYTVEIRPDLLDEVDGPMLEHGLKQRHKQKLMMLPRTAKERPDRELLKVTYDKFLLAQTA
ncbi:HNH endonuclease [Glutamicibacter arilaitensis]|uniref:HNH endonuclease n=1 Tax=Glutamicibacter arilaitensis TaxID=256701 RepID=UPI003FD156B7